VDIKIVNFLEKYFPWVVFLVVSVLNFVFWGIFNDWSFSGLNAYQLFPILGIYAWTIMWTHYVISATRIYSGKVKKNYLYSAISSYLVLILLLMHPGLLVWAQWDTLGLVPPESIYGFVAGSLKVFVFFGTLSLILFLSYEVFSRLQDKDIIKKNWKWISLSQMLAMVLIFVHAIKLGGISDLALFEVYWVLMGLILLPCFYLIASEEWKKR
jgi:hypothetical protein